MQETAGLQLLQSSARWSCRDAAMVAGSSGRSRCLGRRERREEEAGADELVLESVGGAGGGRRGVTMARRRGLGGGRRGSWPLEGDGEEAGVLQRWSGAPGAPAREDSPGGEEEGDMGT